MVFIYKHSKTRFLIAVLVEIIVLLSKVDFLLSLPINGKVVQYSVPKLRPQTDVKLHRTTTEALPKDPKFGSNPVKRMGDQPVNAGIGPTRVESLLRSVFEIPGVSHLLRGSFSSLNPFAKGYT